MKLILCKNYEEISNKAAEIIAEQVNKKSDSILGLATGATPVGTYKRLIEMNKNNEVDFKDVKTFNLDEYYPISRTNPQSYYKFMRDNLFDYINIDLNNTHIPNGETENPDEECMRYEDEVTRSGGVDLQILGIGRNGHIGFNEPSDSLISATHLTPLTQDTIDANAHFFDDRSEVPTHALTMGMATILKAKKIILLANGRSKLNAVKSLLSETITTDTPATMLKMHPDVTIICDYDAYTERRLGIDIGGMSAKIGVVENNQIIEKTVFDINSDMNADDILDGIVALSRELIEKHSIEAVGIGVPGINRDGYVTMSNLPFENYRLGDKLSEKLKMPVKLNNDANCAALGEQIAGGKTYDNVVLLTIGTGIGGGIIIDGKIYSGRGSAGEVGHIVVERDGRKCNCGEYGCWEKYASVSSLIDDLKKAIENNSDAILTECAKDGVDGKTVFAAIDKGSQVAAAIFDRYIEYLALGIKNLINIFDPELILLAGGITKENDRLLSPLKAKITDFDRIEIAKLQNDAGIIGAAMQ